MDIKEYESKLMSLLKQLVDKDIDRVVFIESARKLGKELDKSKYKSIGDFTNKDLGWAKYWVEETDYYGIDKVFESMFDFVDFYSRNSSK